jgi:hypothetical protein
MPGHAGHVINTAPPLAMKFFATVFAAILALSTVASAQTRAAVPAVLTPKNLKIEKIVPTIVGTPEFSVTNIPPKRSMQQKWLEIEVEFAVEGIEVVEELTFKFDVMIMGKLFPGEITHVNIPKGKERYTVMYISPRNLERITGGKQFTPANVDNVWIQITKQGQVLAASSIKDKTGRLAVPNAQQFPGFLTPKAETPFAPLWSDRYEAVKQTR